MGDGAVLVECAPGAGPTTAELIRTVPGVVEAVPAASTVLAVVAPRRLDVVRQVLETLEEPAADRSGTGAEVVVDVVYDGADLPALAAASGMSVQALVERHTADVWTSAFIGFAPGFAYLTGTGLLPAVERRQEARVSVPAGSVALAGPWSAVYPTASPGGWQLLGRTDSAVWDVGRTPPALLVPGTRVRFRAVRAGLSGASRASETAGGAGTAGRQVPRRSPDDVASPWGHRGATAVGVVSTGPLALLEDLGRPGRLDVGVPRGGALDRGAAVRANRLVGNPRDAAVVEVTLGGLVIRADGDLVVTVTGAPTPLEIRCRDGASRPGRETPFALRDGAELALGHPPTGMRTYVAVRGGVDTPAVLGSRSVDLLSGLARPLAAGDRLAVGPSPGDAVALAPEPQRCPAPEPTPVAPHRVRVLPGPRADRLDPSAPGLCDRPWTVLDASNRVGLRLDGPPLRTVPGELPSEGTVPGAVQVPPSGRPVVFLADHPVTGGYPVVAVVVEADLDLLAQVRPGEQVVLVRG